MNRRHFLALGIASGISIVARGDEKKLRVGVIGHTGRGNYGHGLDTMWTQIPETEITAVADADAKGLAAEQKKLGGIAGFADYRKMLAEVKPDIVAVAPRFVDEHRDMILAPIEAGAHGIFIQFHSLLLNHFLRLFVCLFSSLESRCGARRSGRLVRRRFALPLL